MVVGNGMIAKRFQPFADHKEFIIFAAGVSNSRANDAAAYERETTLLKETVRAYPAAALVYFSTCCLYDPAEVNSPYTQHKQQIENYIRSECNRYHVFRISHLAGISDNNHTILNFLVRNIFNERKFSLWTNATRNIIDVDDAYQIIDYILNENITDHALIKLRYRVRAAA